MCSPGVACEAGGYREQQQAKGFRFSAARVVIVQGEGLHPGGQVEGESDAIGVEVAERQVPQAGVLGGADAVLAARPSAVP